MDPEGHPEAPDLARALGPAWSEVVELLRRDLAAFVVEAVVVRAQEEVEGISVEVERRLHEIGVPDYFLFDLLDLLGAAGKLQADVGPSH